MRYSAFLGLVFLAGCHHVTPVTTVTCTPTSSGVNCVLPPNANGYALTIEPAGGVPPQPTEGVQVGPGDDLQAKINANPEGTQFVLLAGTHRNKKATPKNNQKFTGQTGTILSGARVLSPARENTYWVASVGSLQPIGPTIGECVPEFPQCTKPEDLFYTDSSGVKPQKRMGGLPVAAGQWYLDYGAGKVYMGSDPGGKTVELSTTDAAFTGNASGVVVEGMTIEKYATPAQYAAVNYHGDGKAWIVRNNEVRWCHGMAIRSSDNSQLLNNRVHDIGELGMGGSGANVLVQGNELYSNNLYAGYLAAWEGGPTKFTYTTNLKILNNNSHDNAGVGWWTDIDNYNVEVANNTFARNGGGGYSHEISYDMKIHDNTFTDNAPGGCSWLWGGAIQIQNSQNVEAWNNTIQVPANGCGHAITIIQQSRGSGARGPYNAVNNYVHDNTIKFMQVNSGASGGVMDSGPDIFAASSNNRFANNHYSAKDPTGGHFAWANSFRSFASMQSMGQETGSTMAGF